MEQVCSFAEKKPLHRSASRLRFLGPAGHENKSDLSFDRAHHADRHANLIARIQKLRGRIYLDDNAIEESELINGGHYSPVDADSWHILIEDADREIKACVRVQAHHPATDASKFSVYKSAIAKDPQWRAIFADAMQKELELARLLQIPILEVGGLALHESVRGTSAVLKLVLGIYGLAKSVGGAVGLSTVTTRHGASSILRRLGGKSMTHSGLTVPPYYDPQYRCDMEVLKFYSWNPSLRYEARFIDVQQHFVAGLPAIVSMHWRPSKAQRAATVAEKVPGNQTLVLGAHA